MTILTNNLYKALLAMDAYNRGYGVGLELPANSADNLGNATIIDDSGILRDNSNIRRDQPAGFYAIAYDLNGEKVISYRGTDEVVVAPWSGTGSDLWNGYGVGLGVTAGNQAMLAFDFYNAVAGNVSNPRTANISLTGHSLGGGLAGLVSSVYGKTGTLFNNMAYEGAAQDTYVKATYVAGSDPDPYYDVFRITLRNIIKHNIYKDFTPLQPDQGAAITHETGDDIQGTKGDLIPPGTFGNDFLDGNRVHKASDIHYAFVDSSLVSAGVPTPTLDGIQSHSMSSLTLLIYADIVSPDSNWQFASKYLWPVLYDNAFANRLAGVNNAAGTMKNSGDYSGILRTALAYSVIDEGTKLFGTTGAKALFNDASDFGLALKSSPSTLLKDNQYEIDQIIVQYAGGLAMNKNEDSSYTVGALTYQNTIPCLEIDLSSARWNKSMNSENLIIGGDALISNLLFQPADQALNQSLMQQLWGTSNTTAFDRVVLAAKDSGGTFSVAYAGDAAKAGLIAGGAGADNITASNKSEFILGGNSNDTITAGAGNDILHGGDGNDVLYGSADSDMLYGDTGNDTLDGGDGKDRYAPSDGDDTVNDTGIGDVILGYTGTAIETTTDSGIYKLGDATITKSGADLKLTYAGGSMTLTNWVKGDFGITTSANDNITLKGICA